LVFAILLLVALLAFANGSNDNGKGVATLVGFGAARPHAALRWATLTTMIGSVVSFWFAGGLIENFSTGLFAEGTPVDGSFFAAVLIGAICWVLLATFTGLPVSTTHAITGGLVGAGLTAFSASQLRWGDLGSKFAIPLALSPLLSVAVVYVVSLPIVAAVRRYRAWCLCVVERPAIPCAPGLACAAAPAVDVVVDTEENCAEQAPSASVTVGGAGNAIHWTTSGLVGFARGWNDAPKIAALGIGTLTAAGVPQSTGIAFAVVTVAMAMGGLIAGRRVLETMAKKLTPLPLAESLTASSATAAMVSAASWFGLPVSTTHVSTGAIIGAGLRNDPRQVRWGKVGEIVLSWIVTLPVAALFAAVAKWAMS
jgi:inorganic phosphate transporter, PiT family